MTTQELREMVSMIRQEHENIMGQVRDAECIPVIEYLIDRDFETHKRLNVAEKELAAVSF